MRVTALTMADQLAGEVENQQSAITTLDEELSSGRALMRPSDNPVAVADTLGYSRQVALASTQQASATTAKAWLGLGNDTANSVISTLQSVQTTVLQALNSGANNNQTYNEMAQTVEGVVSQMLGFANTQYGTTAIFAGTASVGTPYSAAGAYSGNAEPFTIDVGDGAPVAVSVPGDQLFGGGASGTQSVFTTLANIVTDLQSGPGSASYANLQGDLNALGANITQAESAATSLGESTDRVAAASTVAQNTATQIQTVLASTEDTDIAAVTGQLQSDQTTYQAALYAISQTVPESLAQYLTH